MFDTCDERDVLISRVIDGEASRADWQRLRTMAESDASIWSELEEAQQMQSTLCAEVAPLLEGAGAVELPSDHAEQTFSRQLARVGAWGGWLAAAAVGLAWSLGVPQAATHTGATSGMGPSIPAGYVRIDSPEDALQTYVARGRDAGSVVGLVPEPRIVETRSLPDGSGVEVLYVREILERRLVDQVYRLSQDDAGNVRPVQVPIVPASERRY